MPNRLIPLANPANRVLQLDAKLLDNEISDMLYRQLSGAFNSNRLPSWLGRIHSNYASELKLLLELLIFKVTVWNKHSSYGLTLQNLVMYDGGVHNKKFRSKQQSELRVTKKILLLSSVLLGYFVKKIQSYVYSFEDYDLETDGEDLSTLERIRLKTIKLLKSQISTLEKAHSVLSLVNFVTFLVSGSFPDLTTRILNIRFKPLVTTQVAFASNPETISYEFQNRQLVWNTLTEFIVFILPALSVPKFTKSLVSSITGTSPKSSQVTDEDLKVFSSLPERVCAICFQNSQNSDSGAQNDISLNDTLVTNPYETTCGHIYCYVCILSKLQIFKEEGKNLPKSDPNKYWHCLRCNEPASWCRVYTGDVEDALRQKAVEEVTEDEDASSEDEEKRDQDSEGAKTVSQSFHHVNGSDYQTASFIEQAELNENEYTDGSEVEIYDAEDEYTDEEVDDDSPGFFVGAL
ncbi:Peroxin and E3 ubiquitin ligase [Komagataella phaffii CBS 7435]|uniref:Peroxisomal biogenesis factor 2 n=3 Tax=Komagataella TaxID=460517 RepID=PEX2_KOMPG|nr:peroxisomal integral membrane protein [Komagataella phaffii GS115]Q01964.1 RecName: Full=Peroxisomal biogenesis factor 2; AltName: Full=Peroxin-2; AltName: Full=Peroxisomal protein PER6 [Komagataella pastoris]AOA64178.1 GQ67_03053T0 [Komagataella phaffii]CAH2450313.1 Peroxin and E3 ubiquitin ligase [Komagataella phaffii CBS 7435]AOA68586.1 GQ68_03038T0 [Komagataella phaffii GS115]CAA65646.1 peroxin-2 [Komagataella pastoris]CAY69969.1 peroxisomal integral membrane protein [Komagataella phaf